MKEKAVNKGASRGLPLASRLFISGILALGSAMFVFIALFYGRVPVRHSFEWHAYRGHELEFIAKTALFVSAFAIFAFALLFEADRWAGGQREAPIKLSWLINLGSALLFVICCAAMVGICRDVARLAH